ITGQDCYRRIKSLGLAIGVSKSGCQNGFAFVFQKLGRMTRAIDRRFDSQVILPGWILWCEDLARQCSRSVLAFATQHILPDGAISGWERPFRPGRCRAKQYGKQNCKEPRHRVPNRAVEWWSTREVKKDESFRGYIRRNLSHVVTI